MGKSQITPRCYYRPHVLDWLVTLDLSDVLFRLMFMVVRHADDQGNYDDGIRKLAALTRSDNDRVIRRLEALAAVGLLTVTKPGNGHRDTYHLNVGTKLTEQPKVRRRNRPDRAWTRAEPFRDVPTGFQGPKANRSPVVDVPTGHRLWTSQPDRLWTSQPQVTSQQELTPSKAAEALSARDGRGESAQQPKRDDQPPQTAQQPGDGVRPGEANSRSRGEQAASTKQGSGRCADPRIAFDDGEPSVNGFYLNETFEKALDAAGFDPTVSRVSWQPVIEWLAAGYDTEQIVAVIRSVIKRGARPMSLNYFNGAMRDQRPAGKSIEAWAEWRAERAAEKAKREAEKAAKDARAAEPVWLTERMFRGNPRAEAAD